MIDEVLPTVVLSMSDAASMLAEVAAELERAVVGKPEAIEMVLTGLLADGHVLLEDVPGVAKTLLARSLAQVFGLRFSRLQCTPDLLPGDVTGSPVIGSEGRLEFRPGPVFANLVLVDEINRASPKTQAALLEAMEERQVTIDGQTHALARPFFVVATQNPVEFEGTYPLPEAQLDRFLLRTTVGYPDADNEWEMLRRRGERRADRIELNQVCAIEDVRALLEATERVHLSEPVGRYVVDLVGATRRTPQLQLGASPRGTLALAKAARARALLRGRDYVVPDDVKGVAAAVLAHRVLLPPELWVRRIDPATIVGAILDSVAVPTVER